MKLGSQKVTESVLYMISQQLLDIDFIYSIIDRDSRTLRLVSFIFLFIVVYAEIQAHSEPRSVFALMIYKQTF